MTLKPVSENSSFEYTFTVYDTDGTAVTPTTVEYRVDCLTNRRTVRDWTSVTPATEMTISVAPEDNEIFRDANTRELRQLSIRCNAGLSNQFLPPDPIQWYVNNLLSNRSITP